MEQTQSRGARLPAFSRRRLFGSAAAVLAGGSARAANVRPNILWLAVEDVATDFGCYGNPAARTPNIDRLAAEGTLFRNAYVTAPVCSPSRSAIATGMYQTAIGAHHHRGNHEVPLPDGVHVFTHYLRQAGYHTSNVVTAAEGVRGTGKTDFNFKPPEAPFDGTDWRQRAAGQPFYAQVNFRDVHRVWRRYRPNPTDPAKVVIPPYYPDHPAVREDWAMYCDSMQQVDSEVGKVLQRLDEERLAENTIVVLFGDNGVAMPRDKEYLYEGGIHVPLIVRAPKGMRIPGAEPGTVRTELISLIDLTATTLELAGARPPAHMAGVPFLGPNRQAREYVFAARDRCDETYDRMRAVRGKRFKYIRNYHPEIPYTQANADRDVEIPTLRVMRQLHEKGELKGVQARYMGPRKPAEELYDLERDPHEMTNLAASREHAPQLRELRAALDRWIAETRDRGAQREDPAAMITPQEIEYRTQVDGWCTLNYTGCRLSRTADAMRAQCSGKRNLVRRSYVTEGGELEVRFSLRSGPVSLKTFGWGTIFEFNNAANKKTIDSVADGKPHEHAVAFHAESHLARLEFDFGEAEGAVDFDWIRVYRKRQGQAALLDKEWRFRR